MLAQAIGMKRIKIVADQIRAVCEPIAATVLAENDAKKSVKRTSKEGITTRETIMAKLAKLSVEEQWTDDEIDGAATYIKSNADQTEKTVAVLVSQIKVAAKPLVRENFGSIITVINDAWAEEQDAKEAGLETPLRKLKARRYALVCHILVQIAEKKLAPTFDADDLLAYAESKAEEKKIDAEKARKKIEAIVKQIDELHSVFPYEDLRAASANLRNIDVYDLEESRLKPKTLTARMEEAVSAPQFLQTAKQQQADGDGIAFV
jgi:hypothetical protein